MGNRQQAGIFAQQYCTTLENMPFGSCSFQRAATKPSSHHLLATVARDVKNLWFLNGKRARASFLSSTWHLAKLATKVGYFRPCSWKAVVI